MTEVKNRENSHKKIAMKFLLSNNLTLDQPICEKKIEHVYDLFSGEGSETQSLQKSLQKIINR